MLQVLFILNVPSYVPYSGLFPLSVGSRNHQTQRTSAECSTGHAARSAPWAVGHALTLANLVGHVDKGDIFELWNLESLGAACGLEAITSKLEATALFTGFLTAGYLGSPGKDVNRSCFLQPFQLPSLAQQDHFVFFTPAGWSPRLPLGRLGHLRQPQDAM